MNRIDPVSPDVESLLADERVLVPQAEDVRRRAIARARVAMSSGPAMAASRAGRGGFRGMRLLVAAALALVVVSAAALGVKRTLAKRLAASPFAAASNVASPPPSDPPSSTPVGPAAPPIVAAPAAPNPPASPRPPTVAESYALELKVLEPARAAAARGDFASTLASVAEHERKFPNGQLVEEREALRVRALSGEQRWDEAHRAAAAFRKRFPGSVLLPRMKEAASQDKF